MPLIASYGEPVETEASAGGMSNEAFIISHFVSSLLLLGRPATMHSQAGEDLTEEEDRRIPNDLRPVSRRMSEAEINYRQPLLRRSTSKTLSINIHGEATVAQAASMVSVNTNGVILGADLLYFSCSSHSLGLAFCSWAKRNDCLHSPHSIR